MHDILARALLSHLVLAIAATAAAWVVMMRLVLAKRRRKTCQPSMNLLRAVPCQSLLLLLCVLLVLLLNLC